MIFGKNVHSTHVCTNFCVHLLISELYSSPFTEQFKERFSNRSHLRTSPHHLPRTVLTSSRQAALPLLQPFLHLPHHPTCIVLSESRHLLLLQDKHLLVCFDRSLGRLSGRLLGPSITPKNAMLALHQTAADILFRRVFGRY